MTKLEITPSDLIVHVRGWDRFWAFKRELRAPLNHVVGVERATDKARKLWHGFRAPGTHLPGVITAIEIRLRDHRFAGFVVEVEDPDADVAALSRALRLDVGASARSFPV